MSSPLIGVINLIGEPDALGPITSSRCLASVPFGARYRLIDFVLSGMVNSGISKVAVFTDANYRSLLDHLGSGRHWNLHLRESGLFVLPPVSPKSGDLYHFNHHCDFFLRSKEPFVAVTRGHVVCNVDFAAVLAFHEEKNADITIVCTKRRDPRPYTAPAVETDETSRVVSLTVSGGQSDSRLVSMEIYVLRKSLLLELARASQEAGPARLVHDGIAPMVGEWKVYAYRHNGYTGIIDSIEHYFLHNMDLLEPDVWNELFFHPGPIFTKIKDEPPTRFQAGAEVSRSLIANGCVIEGTVENSILFRGVRVHKKAVVRNSIVMQNGEIGESAVVDCAILDKEAKVQQGRHVCGTERRPLIVGKRQII
ncbi:MAG: glucose-1-phosphate adenylyltransferase subunit GlgD [Candidatus Reconcilbacillus cellulovorans]|uniref:Glucose-1-phosphate adenylyltransferase subunit GlgD n=1 Tax=Candidatus Reconcilbacillus cellulovorans TaxID=1906605 RepID=A0A2A6DY64_9BACL|nr:MAG: glucose-1-phosphate adenylyltransferase subunit GlgD [Candidatus Reconcilbacillus cellulovorans]